MKGRYISPRDSSKENNALKNDFKCDICSSVFQSGTLLHKHLRTMSCSKTSLLTSSLETIDIVKETNVSRFACQLCGHVYWDGAEYELHVNSHIQMGRSSPMAYVGGLVKDEEKTLDKLGVTGPVQYSCGVCQQTFQDTNTFNRHMQSHLMQPSQRKTTDAAFTCSGCQQSYTSNGSFLDHLVTCCLLKKQSSKDPNIKVKKQDPVKDGAKAGSSIGCIKKILDQNGGKAQTMTFEMDEGTVIEINSDSDEEDMTFLTQVNSQQEISEKKDAKHDAAVLQTNVIEQSPRGEKSMFDDKGHAMFPPPRRTMQITNTVKNNAGDQHSKKEILTLNEANDQRSAVMEHDQSLQQTNVGKIPQEWLTYVDCAAQSNLIKFICTCKIFYGSAKKLKACPCGPSRFRVICCKCFQTTFTTFKSLIFHIKVCSGFNFQSKNISSWLQLNNHRQGLDAVTGGTSQNSGFYFVCVECGKIYTDQISKSGSKCREYKVVCNACKVDSFSDIRAWFVHLPSCKPVSNGPLVNVVSDVVEGKSFAASCGSSTSKPSFLSHFDPSIHIMAARERLLKKRHSDSLKAKLREKILKNIPDEATTVKGKKNEQGNDDCIVIDDLENEPVTMPDLNKTDVAVTIGVGTVLPAESGNQVCCESSTETKDASVFEEGPSSNNHAPEMVSNQEYVTEDISIDSDSVSMVSPSDIPMPMTPEIKEDGIDVFSDTACDKIKQTHPVEAFEDNETSSDGEYSEDSDSEMSDSSGYEEIDITLSIEKEDITLSIEKEDITLSIEKEDKMLNTEKDANNSHHSGKENIFTENEEQNEIMPRKVGIKRKVEEGNGNNSGNLAKQSKQDNSAVDRSSEVGSSEDCQYQCYECKKEFSGVDSLLSHMSIHKKNRSSGAPEKQVEQRSLAEEYVCGECGRAQPTLAVLQQHILSHMAVSKEFICGLCKLQFASEAALARHMHDHSVAKESKNKGAVKQNEVQCDTLQQLLNYKAHL